jgi:undecaprenyl-diphosphatase
VRRPLVLVGLLAVALLAAAAGLVWAAAAGVGPATADPAALADALTDRTSTLTRTAVVLTTIGSTVAMAVLAVVVGGVLWWRGHRLEGGWLVGTMLTASAVFTLVKRLVDRPRPPEAARLVQVGNESLPSGHATMSAAVVGALVVLAWPYLHGVWRVIVPLAALVWIAGVGLTRVYLGVHWFSDVLAGWATGFAWLAVCTAVLLWLRPMTPVTAPG